MERVSIGGLPECFPDSTSMPGYKPWAECYSNQCLDSDPTKSLLGTQISCSFKRCFGSLNQGWLVWILNAQGARGEKPSKEPEGRRDRMEWGGQDRWETTLGVT